MSDIGNKVKKLVGELNLKCARELSLAKWSHWLNVLAMLLTLIGTAVAFTYGVLPGHSSGITAALALVPGGIALVATSLKLEARCNWHYKRYYALSALIRTLEIELPDLPTQEQLTSVSVSLSKLEIDMEVAWEKDIALEWTHFQKKE